MEKIDCARMITVKVEDCSTVCEKESHPTLARAALLCRNSENALHAAITSTAVTSACMADVNKFLEKRNWLDRNPVLNRSRKP